MKTGIFKADNQFACAVSMGYMAGLGRGMGIAMWICMASVTSQAAAPGHPHVAFPGSVGFGAGAVGWRGGEVVRVTNLDDEGPGSLRACAERTKAPRVCVFAVSGTIALTRPIMAGSNLYLAGQTAPGQGVQIKLDGGDATPLIVKNQQHVLIRYLKLRPGPPAGKSANVDAITIESSRNVYLDHLSLNFASDETFNIHVNKRPSHDITIAHSLLAFSLDSAGHPDGKHSKGALICSSEGPPGQGEPCGRISLIGNLFAHHRDRNPDVNGTDIGPVEVINNVIYNPISQFGEFYDVVGDVSVHYVANLAIAGRDTRPTPAPRAVEAYDVHDGNTLRIYISDNRNLRHFCGDKLDLPVVDENARPFLIDQPTLPLTTDPLPSSMVLEAVLGSAGARLPQWGGTDALDRRALDSVRSCSGRVIDMPDMVGGWPVLPEQEGLPDSDEDGMPDEWERDRTGLDATDPSDAWEDRDDDGWPNLEEYLNTLAGDVEAQ